MDANEKRSELVKNALNVLGEHFDTVQIFVTAKDSDGTYDAVMGQENYYARFGHVRHWLLKQEEETRENARKSDEE